MKNVKIGDFLTAEQIKKCAELRTAAAICEQVTKPNIAAINAKLGQENDPNILPTPLNSHCPRNRR